MKFNLEPEIVFAVIFTIFVIIYFTYKIFFEKTNITTTVAPATTQASTTSTTVALAPTLSSAPTQAPALAQPHIIAPAQASAEARAPLANDDTILPFNMDNCINEFGSDLLTPEYEAHKKRCDDADKCYRKYTKAPYDEETQRYTLDYKNYIKICDDIKLETTPITPTTAHIVAPTQPQNYQVDQELMQEAQVLIQGAHAIIRQGLTSELIQQAEALIQQIQTLMQHEQAKTQPTIELKVQLQALTQSLTQLQHAQVVAAIQTGYHGSLDSQDEILPYPQKDRDWRVY